MSQQHSGGNIQPQLDLEENDETGGVPTLKVLAYGVDYDTSLKTRIAVDQDGIVQAVT